MRPALTASFIALCLGCVIATSDHAGEICQTNADCGDPDYACTATTADGPRTCQVIFPPGSGGADAGDAGPVIPAYWCNEVEPLMQTYCVSCHGADRSGSGEQPFRLDLYDDEPDGGLPGAKTKAPRIKIRTTDLRDMPPFGSPMPTDAERDTIGRWVQSGAPFCADGGM